VQAGFFETILILSWSPDDKSGARSENRWGAWLEWTRAKPLRFIEASGLGVHSHQPAIAQFALMQLVTRQEAHPPEP
jgi:hypothetical protein